MRSGRRRERSCLYTNNRLLCSGRRDDTGEIILGANTGHDAAGECEEIDEEPLDAATDCRREVI